MYVVKHQDKATGTTDYHPEKPFILKPVIDATFFTGKGKNKVRMYRGKDGREFIASLFDKMFLPAIVLQVKHKHYKSKSLDARVIE
jgi:hypothetical protein